MSEHLVTLMLGEFGAEHVYADDIDYYKSIAGKEIEVRFVHGDAFQVGSDYWLPKSTWTETSGEQGP